MSLGKGVLFTGISSLALLAGLAVAGETPSSSKENGAVEKNAKPAAAESVGQLIKQLDAAEFDTREAACTKLAAKGKWLLRPWRRRPPMATWRLSPATTVLEKRPKSSDEATVKEASGAPATSGRRRQPRRRTQGQVDLGQARTA